MLHHSSLKGKKILITSGPTWVKIDDVRVISNMSSGMLGRLIAQECARSKAKVTLLQGPVITAQRIKDVAIKDFLFFDELKGLLAKETRRHDIIIHAAAVADYRAANVAGKKISSKKKTLTLRLKRNEKLIDRIKKQNPRAFLVGFKLEPQLEESISNAKNLFTQANCDLVVANSFKGGYRGCILGRAGGVLARAHDRRAMAKKLVTTIGKSI